MTELLLVAVGAAVGAPMRYLTDRLIHTHHDSVFPWGTLTVNAIGSAVLGFLIGLPADPALMTFAGSGLCGALTTYSTFSYETLRLAQDSAYYLALANITGIVVAGLGAGYIGLAAAQTISA